MSFSQRSNEPDNPQLFTGRGDIRGDLPPDQLRRLLQQRAIPGLPFGPGLLASLLGGAPVGFGLPSLPKIPRAKPAPARATDKRISAAARKARVLAAQRHGRASTILGGSVGAPGDVRSLIGR